MKPADAIRPPSSQRGYSAQWRRVRSEVLTAAGISPDRHHLYAVDHNPAFPSLGYDHSKYKLTPMLRGMHSRRTNQSHGGFGKGSRVAAWRMTDPLPGELFPEQIYEQRRSYRPEDLE